MAFTRGHWLALALFQAWTRAHPDEHPAS
jgi:hypothetical protein